MAVANVDLFGQVFTNGAAPGAGNKIQTYAGGTDTPLATYTSATGGVANANPIVADSAGRYECWATTGVAYDFVLLTAADVVLDRVVNFVVGSGIAASGSSVADVVFTYGGGPPTAVQWLGGERFARAVSFPANFSGSYGFAHSNPNASFVIDVQKNGTTCGTITVSTGGVFTFATAAGATVSFATGDRIDAYGPTPADTTLTDFGWTLAGSVG